MNIFVYCHLVSLSICQVIVMYCSVLCKYLLVSCGYHLASKVLRWFNIYVGCIKVLSGIVGINRYRLAL
jgi:hypothetical protein